MRLKLFRKLHRMLTIEDLFFSYGDRPTIDGLSLHLPRNSITTIIGGSGSGKTTLFKLIAGLLTPHKGKITLTGPLSYMMQEDLLLPWRTTLENIALPKELGRGFKEHDVADKLCNDVGLSDFKDCYPHELSGGMRQRVALARALLQKRPLLLLDEPFGALDVALREQMYSLLLEIPNKTLLLITHDFRDALTLSDTIYLLSEGKLTKRWDIPKEVRLDPKLAGLYQQELRNAITKTPAKR